jgi:hypothetical protein
MDLTSNKHNLKYHLQTIFVDLKEERGVCLYKTRYRHHLYTGCAQLQFTKPLKTPQYSTTLKSLQLV